MNALLIAATVAACAAADHGVLVGKHYQIQVVLHYGDPLGSPEDGTVAVLCEPQLVVAAGTSCTFMAGNRQPVVGYAFQFTAKPWPGGTAALAAELALHTPKPSPDGERATVVTTRSDHHRTVELGKPVALRLSADSPTRQTWAVVTVTEIEPAGPRPQAGSSARRPVPVPATR